MDIESVGKREMIKWVIITMCNRCYNRSSHEIWNIRDEFLEQVTSQLTSKTGKTWQVMRQWETGKQVGLSREKDRLVGAKVWMPSGQNLFVF